MIKEAYVSYEVAKLLKEKGFNERVSRWYVILHPEEGVVSRGFGAPSLYISAPTQQMAMQWLREEKHLFPCIQLFCNGEWTCFIITMDNYIETDLIGNYATYEEACEASIKYCLEKLI